MPQGNVNVGCTASALRRSGSGEKGLQSGNGLASLADGHGRKEAIAKSRKRYAAKPGAGRHEFPKFRQFCSSFEQKPKQSVVDKFSRPTGCRSSFGIVCSCSDL